MGNEKDAISEIMNWKKPPEIMSRRRKEQILFARGVYSNTGVVSVYPALNGNVVWSKGKRIDIKSMLADIMKPESKPVTKPITTVDEPKKTTKTGIAGFIAIVLAVAGFIIAKLKGIL